MENQFLGNQHFNISNQTRSATCPSNIALIKYWGKYANQIPANPSISYTLNHCNTKLQWSFGKRTVFCSDFLAGNEEVKFAEKIENILKILNNICLGFSKGNTLLKPKNTFPHSSGIASSASGFGAIASCLMSLDEIFSTNNHQPSTINQKKLLLARLGSGSACRSLYNRLVVWGKRMK